MVNLAQTLIQHNLIDEYRLWIFAAVLGCGQRLFREGSKKLNLRLIDTKHLSSRGIILTYSPEDITLTD
ncbi:dihydrofolate reductase family protein [Bacillus sp. FJAT-27238]|uniref:dihydrofolate reductase family protein n=1 Tax=Bacillales TaxID=1385 RepID=UPI0009DA5D05